MKPNELDQHMRALEWYHDLRFLPSAWLILRLDGRSFSRFTETRFSKPFDTQFNAWMTQAAQALLDEFQGLYAYTESDEISVLCPREWSLFDRELEKTVSLSAAIVSASFSLACGTPVHFDSRAWLGATDEQVIDYFRWRQADATRCALHGWCYWTLRKAGRSVAEATAALTGKDVADKNELLFQHGINFNDVPCWQRRGTGLYWETVAHEGYNPVSAQKVTTTRRRIKIDRDLPMGAAYSTFVAGLMHPS